MNLQHSTHFEWVVEYESTLKKLISEVFENVGVEDEFSVNLTVKAVDNFQEYLKIRILALARKVFILYIYEFIRSKIVFLKS